MESQAFNVWWYNEYATWVGPPVAPPRIPSWAIGLTWQSHIRNVMWNYLININYPSSCFQALFSHSYLLQVKFPFDKYISSYILFIINIFFIHWNIICSSFSVFHSIKTSQYQQYSMTVAKFIFNLLFPSTFLSSLK